jgi:hypothetical protein
MFAFLIFAHHYYNITSIPAFLPAFLLKSNSCLVPQKRPREDNDLTSVKVPKVDVQKPCNILGETVEVAEFNKSGLSMQQKVSIFVRQDVVDLWNTLCKDYKFTAVHGPPGVGKSTGVWAWARYTSITTKTKVYWIHTTPGDNCVYSTIDSNDISTVAVNTQQQLFKLMENTGDGILIVDGMAAKDLLPFGMFASVRTWFEEAQDRRRVVVVASESLRFV